jgi:hypothetical protein
MLHVTCKHCGQTVEVQDLLAAAEQPCAHCGQPLLDDAPTPNNLPGAAAPQQPGILDRWFRGNCIVISRADAMKTPPKVCIVCGSTATHVAQESFQVLYSTFVKYFTLRVPYCDRHYRKYLRWSIGTWVICLIMMALWLLYPHALDSTAVSPMVAFALGLAGALFIFLVYSQFRHVGFVAYEDYIEVRGASSQYVLAMQESQAKRLDDVP